MNQTYLIVGLCVALFVVICYIIYTKMSTQENLSMGTINQLYARDDQDRYLTTDPIPYEPWMYNPLTFWNMSTRMPYSLPYYIGVHNYYKDGMMMDAY